MSSEFLSKFSSLSNISDTFVTICEKGLLNLKFFAYLSSIHLFILDSKSSTILLNSADESSKIIPDK